MRVWVLGPVISLSSPCSPPSQEVAASRIEGLGWFGSLLVSPCGSKSIDNPTLGLQAINAPVGDLRWRFRIWGIWHGMEEKATKVFEA